MTDQPQPSNGNGSGLSGADMLALMGHITGLLTAMEGRIMDRLTENASGATIRWSAHETKHAEELADNTKRIVDRFVKLETALDSHIVVLNAHLKKEELEDITVQARVQPVKTLGMFLVANWRTLVIVMFIVLGLFGWTELDAHIAGR